MGKPLSEDDALHRIAHRRRRTEQRRRAFKAILPEQYPEPRADLEWRAYRRLRGWWSRPLILRCIEAHATDELAYPGNVGQDGRPDVEQFLTDIGLLAEGEYARTLPEADMLTLLAGKDAALGRDHSRTQSQKGKKGMQARWGAKEHVRELRRRGLRCLLDEDPNITASVACGWLEGNPRTYDDDDVKLCLDTDGSIVVEDLDSGEMVTIPADQLSTYLNRERG